jgi:hypothetical protein
MMVWSPGVFKLEQKAAKDCFWRTIPVVGRSLTWRSADSDSAAVAVMMRFPAVRIIKKFSGKRLVSYGGVNHLAFL